jgi:hypothetical protein
MFVKVGRAGGLASAMANNGLDIVLPDSARGKIVGRIEYELSPGSVGTYIDVMALKKFCSMRNWSYTAFKDDLAREAVVQEKSMDLFKGTRMASSPTRCLHLVYATNASPISVT